MHFKLSPRQLPHSYAFFRVINRFMVSGDISPSSLPGPPRSKIIDENIDTIRNMVEEKPNSSISLPTPTSNSILKLVNTVKISIASIKIISLLLWMILYQEPKLASNLMEEHLSTNWNTSRKGLIVNFWLGIFFPQMSNIRQYE